MVSFRVNRRVFLVIVYDAESLEIWNIIKRELHI